MEYQEAFKKWISKQSGLIDIKFAINNTDTSRREVIESFLDAEKAIESELCYDNAPEINGGPSEKTEAIIKEFNKA